MNLNKNERSGIRRTLRLPFFIILLLIGTGILINITSSNLYKLRKTGSEGFPDFITANDDYFVTRIGDIPNIDPESYTLTVWGQIDNPRDFTINELYSLNQTERILTTECIGNPTNGPLLSTAAWKGFLVYDLIESHGLRSNATGVKYIAADGYYVYHTLEQLILNGTIGALYMNGGILPPVQGFPLRIVNPGSFGAKQPAWVTEIKIIDMPINDYWDDRGWDTSPPMDVDSTIFFPQGSVEVHVGLPLEIGGAAFGGTRIFIVEYTINDGSNWNQAYINTSIDVDHVWVFWKVLVTFNETGTYSFYTKATDIYNNTQPFNDPFKKDGSNSWPRMIINVIN
ncbi:MAG: molybdopterin-dependent oxidoreductase [Candidatus Lokiarchaeota archaeon]|nr:molybdopterin-dependent oxidoreductase [Candidatus Lokiarchaeota archaeon]